VNKSDIGCAANTKGGNDRIRGIAQKYIVLNSDIFCFVIRFAIVADLQECFTCATLPVEKDIPLNKDSFRPKQAVLILIAVFDDNIMFGSVDLRTITSRKVVEKDIVLNGDIGDAINIQMLFGISLIVKKVIFHCHESRSVIYLEQVIVVGIAEDIVAEDDILCPDILAAAHLNNDGGGIRLAMLENESFQDDVAATGYAESDPCILKHDFIWINSLEPCEGCKPLRDAMAAFINPIFDPNRTAEIRN